MLLKEVEQHKQEILLLCEPTEAPTLESFIQQTLNEFTEIEETKIEKSYRPLDIHIDPKAVRNLTNETIPEDIKMIAGFGPKFCFEPDDNLISAIHFIADTTLHLENACSVESHLQCYKMISSEMSKNRHNKSTCDIWTEFLKYRISKFKAKNPDMLITRSDKGKTAVFINRTDYEEKMTRLITANDDYEEIPTIDIEYLQNKNNNFVDKLINDKTISKIEGNNLKDVCCNASQMYGLIKIHKSNYPVRPITSACASPGFKLSKYFTNVISEIFNENGFHILRSTDIIDKLNNVTIDADDILASFDVVSMFTNIPINLMLDIISKRNNILFEHFHIKFELFADIFIFLLKECAVFMYDKRCFKQKDSLAMGSPLSPILAKILMNEIMNSIIPDIITPKFAALYVDDSLWILKKEEVDVVMENLNKYNPRIKFTIEKEVDGCINFLNLTIKRTKNSKLLMNWYRKSFSSDRLMNYYSKHEKTCIIQTAVAYIKNILKLSSPEFFLQNKIAVEEILRHNCFPETLIISLLNEHYTLLKAPVPTVKFAGEYIPIKLRNNLTRNIKKKIGPFLNKGRLVGVPDRTGTHVFSRIKGKISISEKSNVIIALSCQCENKLILRRTNYMERAENIMNELKYNYNRRKGNCRDNIHRFNKLRHFQIKNFSLMKRTFELLTFAHRARLVNTKIHLPIYTFAKHLNREYYDIQKRISNVIYEKSKNK